MDWVFDVAVTAWHLADWVARDRGAGGATRPQIAQLRVKCPDLTVCEQVCNGVKHLVLDDPQLQPFNVATDVRGTDGRVGVSSDVVAGEGPVDIVLTPSISITDKDGHSWEAATLLHRVLRFWQDELRVPRP